MSNISSALQTTSERREGALVAYVMGGDPNLETSRLAVDAVVRGGADIIEIGIPFSDPIADGGVIQSAGMRALAAGVTSRKILRLISDVRRGSAIPIAIMTYYNILFSQGVEEFLGVAERSGVDGVIIPDLPLEEAVGTARAAKERGIDLILLAAPSTNHERLGKLVQTSSGFLYLVSLYGVTGARDSIGNETLSLVRRTADCARGKIPVMVGFGISRPEHVSSILNAGADGVVVGSALVNIVSRGREDTKKMLSELEAYTRTMKAATRADQRPS